jgi:hypothetical protein
MTDYSTARAPGDVLDYVPNRHHCREGIAIVLDSGRAVDTFWSSERSVLTAGEMATSGLRFRLAEFREISFEQEWLTYAPTDRQVITAQHGLQQTYYVRIGAEPDLATQISNARERVQEAEREVSSAQFSLARRREDLAALESRPETDEESRSDA